jgi:hypothetical protein
MKTTKVIAGEYKVETEAGTFTVKRLSNSWDVWGNYPATDESRWCMWFETKRDALDAIEEHVSWTIEEQERKQSYVEPHYPNAPEGSIWDY